MSIVFSRGFVSVISGHAKCEACSQNRLGVTIEGAALVSTQLCARCLADAVIELLPELSREFIRWRKESAGSAR